MNKPSKCKNCQWYGKPYWSIINPCDSCPNENDYISHVGWYNEGTKQFEKLYTEDYVKNLQERIELAYKSAQLIKDIGFDYDGYNDVENLKKIIDELVDFADDIQRFLRGDE